MTSMKLIKRRITSVNSTKHIMKAMDMVAAAKLQKAKAKLGSVRPLLKEMNHMMDHLRNGEDIGENVYCTKRGVKNTAYVVITSDRGLCGAYNFNVSEKAHLHMNQGKKEKIIVIGSKGRDFFRRRRKNILQTFAGVSDTTFYEEAERIGEQLMSLYTAGEIDEAYIAYTRFESALSYVPCVQKLLPVDRDGELSGQVGEMNYDSGISSFMDSAIPMYIDSQIYVAMVESVTCEHASRMISMDSATHNAAEIIDKLTRTYNRIRQAAITQEINEIISGANMLK